MISLLWFMTALGWAQDDVAPPAEGVEASVEEAATGPDRTSPPAVVPAEWLELDEAEAHELGDGRMVHLVRIPGVRMVEMTVVLHQGYVELGGRSALTEGLGSFLAQATTTRSARDLELLGDLNELSVDGFMSAHAGGASLTVPADGLDLGLDVLGDVLRNPAFPAADVKRESRERHRVVVPAHLVAAGVDGQVPEMNHVLGGSRVQRPAASQHRLDPGDERLRREWLGHVVVGSHRQTDHFVGLLRPGGQHDDRHVGATPQPPQYLDPVHAGHHHVEHHQIRLLTGKELKRLLTIFSAHHPITREL